MPCAPQWVNCFLTMSHFVGTHCVSKVMEGHQDENLTEEANVVWDSGGDK